MKIIRRGTTSNYDKFRFMPGNRQFSQAWADELAEEIKRNNLLELFPVICTPSDGNEKDLLTVDGQHRIRAAEKVGVSVPFVIASDLSPEDLRRINTHHKAWSTQNYLDHFCDLGFRHYLALRQFVYESNIPLMSCVFLHTGTSGTCGNNTHLFRDGKFKITEATLAMHVSEYCKALRAVGVRFSTDRSLVLALSWLDQTGKFKIETLCRRLTTGGMLNDFVKCANAAQYVAMIERIVNYRARLEERVELESAVKAICAKREHESNKTRKK